MKFRKKPIVVGSIKYEKAHIGRVLDFCNVLRYNPHDNEYYVDTPEGCMKVTEGDFIIKGVNGEFYPCSKILLEKLMKSFEAEGRMKVDIYYDDGISDPDYYPKRTVYVESMESFWNEINNGTKFIKYSDNSGEQCYLNKGRIIEICIYNNNKEEE